MSSLSSPELVVSKLEAIENDLADRQNLLEAAALNWFRAKRDREHAYAVAFMRAEGTVGQRQAVAAIESCRVGVEDEALFESLKAVCRTLETRASIGQSILRSQQRS